jgi:hypothetical protein
MRSVTVDDILNSGYESLYEILDKTRRVARRRAHTTKYRKSWAATQYTGEPIDRNFAGIDYVEFLNLRTDSVIRSKTRVQAIVRLRLRAFVEEFGGRGKGQFQISDVMARFEIDHNTALHMVKKFNKLFGTQTAEIDRIGLGHVVGQEARYTLNLDFLPTDDAYQGCDSGPAKPFDRAAAKARRAAYEARRAAQRAAYLATLDAEAGGTVE